MVNFNNYQMMEVYWVLYEKLIGLVVLEVGKGLLWSLLVMGCMVSPLGSFFYFLLKHAFCVIMG